MSAAVVLSLIAMSVISSVVSSSSAGAVAVLTEDEVVEEEQEEQPEEGFTFEVAPFDVGEKQFIIEEEEKEEEEKEVEKKEEDNFFQIKKEEVKREKFKLLRNKDYAMLDMFHFHPHGDNPDDKFDKEKCLNECALEEMCKAVVFDKGMTRCWGKEMADFEIPLHYNASSRIAYVKIDEYEEAMKKYS